MSYMNLVVVALLIILLGCKPPKGEVAAIALSEETVEYRTTGSIERLDPMIDELIAPDAVIEVIADGFTWTEGPLWIEAGGYLLFSDIPPNRIMKWDEDEGTSLYLHPSGYTGDKPRGGEPGSNGLLLAPSGHLVLCQHGDRRVSRMIAPLDAPQPLFETIIDNYEGKRLNSPNDATYGSNGHLYFTDPPYGLEGNVNDPTKEIDFQGVFSYSREGVLSLITADIPRPNGIGLSPDESTLYVASSEGSPMWTKIMLDQSRTVASSQVTFYDSEERDGPGAPDGLKVDRLGNIWATGPGGVWVFNPEGKVLGKIKTSERTSNCAFALYDLR